ncbi:sigma-70 family RNA polymerase sigma factor [Cytobacillus massiliigabonensis]|uniref:sigma-70 family RNA polymerase sigma factor n=1 Tax=Cytobacillus massiliigabonensis TaxID=1871011 RepID=UPI000C832966|nr:sigma-70 family RNA polymerase sigma factor [Cytobacillus massiliigabonensis]
MKKLREYYINDLFNDYLTKGNEKVFARARRELLSEYRKTLTRWEYNSRMIDAHEVEALFDDTVIKVIEYIGKRGGNFVEVFHVSLYNGFKSMLRKIKKRREVEVFELETEDEKTANFEIPSEFNLEEHVLSKRKTDQRQLIGFLVNGEDETTTAIVEAFLNHPKPTATAIAKELGFHHSKVIRALNRLAGKFDTKQFGDYHDYLVAL